MIFLSVLSTEQSFFTPKETIRCVLIAAHVKQGRWDKTSFSWNQEPPGLFSGLNGYKLPAGWRGLLQVEG